MITRPVILFVLICIGLAVNAQNITTIAGNGYIGNVGDDGPATCAGTPNTSGICLDGKGFLYLTVSNSIRKIDLANNTIYRVAGSDSYGSNGDGGPAIDALMQYPYALCMDKKNNLYISEYGGHRIRKINLTTGIISTFAGNGTAGFSGDGGQATLASLNSPQGICTDAADNVYIADFNNHRIRKVDAINRHHYHHCREWLRWSLRRRGTGYRSRNTLSQQCGHWSVRQLVFCGSGRWCYLEDKDDQFGYRYR